MSANEAQQAASSIPFGPISSVRKYRHYILKWKINADEMSNLLRETTTTLRKSGRTLPKRLLGQKIESDMKMQELKN